MDRLTVQQLAQLERDLDDGVPASPALLRVLLAEVRALSGELAEARSRNRSPAGVRPRPEATGPEIIEVEPHWEWRP